MELEKKERENNAKFYKLETFTTQEIAHHDVHFRNIAIGHHHVVQCAVKSN